MNECCFLWINSIENAKLHIVCNSKPIKFWQIYDMYVYKIVKSQAKWESFKKSLKKCSGMYASPYVHVGMCCGKTIGVTVGIRAFCSFCNTVEPVQKCVCLLVCVCVCMNREEQILLWYYIQMILISCKRWMRDCVCSYAT